MENKVTFYSNPMSRGCIVRIFLEAAKIPYEAKLLKYGAEMKSPEYLAVNPLGKVPAIVHNGKVVTEGAAIVAYLSEAFPASGLKPEEGERADFYRWLFFAAGPMDQAVFIKSNKIELTDRQKMSAGCGTLEDVVAAITNHLQGKKFVCGEHLRGVDLFLGPSLNWLIGFGVVQKNAVLDEYLQRILNVDGVQKAIKIDADLAQTPEFKIQ